MQLATYRLSTSAVWADALFVSMLQRSDKPSAGQVRQAIAAAVRAYGGRGCAERVAQEFGDHPETAVARMRWARALASEVFGAAPVPAHQSPRTRPGLLANRPRAWRGGRGDDSEAHPQAQAQDPARAPLARGPDGRPARPRCGPGQDPHPNPLIPD